MRNLVTLCLVACVVLAASFASAANPGQVSHTALSHMGLAGLQPMTDLQGTTVRGKWAEVSGTSYSSVPGVASDTSSYKAGGHSTAAGAAISISAAGIGGSSGHFVVVGSVSVGGSIAVGH